MSEEIVLREALKGVWETVHAISNIVWNAKSEPILKIKQLAEKAESELEAALASQSPASSRPARGTEGDRCDVYTELCKPQTDIKFRLECVRELGHKEPHAYEFPLWPSNLDHAVAIERSQTQGLQAAASPGSEREER